MDTPYTVQANAIRDHILQCLTKETITIIPFPHIICDDYR